MQDQFRYGYRRTTMYDHTAQPTHTDTPLKLEDFLNPRENDVFNHGERHEQDANDLYRMIQNHHRDRTRITVFRSLKICWDITKLDQPVPDVVVVKDLFDPERHRSLLDVKREGLRPCTIIEVTSPLFAQVDLVDKVAIYMQAGVQEYFIVDASERTMTDGNPQIAYNIIGYQLMNSTYERLEPNEEGHLYSAENGFWIGPNAFKTGIVLLDAQSGQAIQPADVRAEKKIAQVSGERRGKDLASLLDL